MRILLFLIILLCPLTVFADVNSNGGSGLLIQENNGTNSGRYRILDFPNGSTVNNNDGSISYISSPSTNPIGGPNIINGAGSQIISPGDLLLEDGSHLQLEDTTYFMLDHGNNLVDKFTLETGGNLLLEDGTDLLKEDSNVAQNHILLENGGNLLLEDGTYLLNENDQSVATGINTSLSPISIPSTSVWVTANSNNVGTVWVGGANVNVGSGGVALLPNVQNTYLPTVDVSKIFITGNAGDGVTFYYDSTLNTGYLTDDVGVFVTDDLGDLILGK